MATEVGTAYVTLLPSAKGFASRMQSELAGEIAKAGKGLGEDLGEEIGTEGGEEAARTFGERLKSGLGKITAVAGGLAIGGTLMKGIGSALESGSLTAKLDAQLGLTEKQSERAGRVAGNLFGDNYGDSMEQVNEAIGLVIQNIDGMRGASEATLGRISTKALNTAGVFDQDLGGVTRAVSQLMRTGMAKNADHAFDILTRGFQTGADKSGDFLDTLNEYGTQFRKLGIDGETATGLISQGLRAGARDGDIVADAFKEFSIRAVDGSEASIAAFQRLGFDAEKMSAKIGGGGKGAAAGLDQVLDRLRSIKDPVKRQAIAVGLFGTQAEDLGDALFKLDPSKAAKGLGKVGGAADEANEAFNDTPTARVQSFTRKLQQGLTEAMSKYVIPAIDALTPLLVDLGSAIDATAGFVKDIIGYFREHSDLAKTLAVVIGTLVVATYAHATALAVSSGALKAWLIQSKIVQVATKTWAAVQWVLNIALNANPIGLIVLGIAALIGIIILIVKKTDFFGNLWDKVWSGIKKAFSAVWDFIKKNWALILGILTGPIGLAVAFIIKNWDKIKAGAAKVVDWLKDMPGKIKDALKAVGGKIKELFTKAWTLAKDAVVKGANKIVDFVKGLPNNVKNALTTLSQKLYDIMTGAFNRAKDAVSGIVDKIVGFVKDLPGKVRDVGSNLLDAAKSLGGKIIDGIVNGITGMAGVAADIADAVGEALENVINGAIGLMNKAIPDKLGWGKFAINIDDNPIPEISLASGGRATAATVAVIGEGREPETVLPDSMLRGLLERTAMGGGPPSVRVFIGDRELTDIVRVEVDGAQTQQVRQLAYGRRL